MQRMCEPPTNYPLPLAECSRFQFVCAEGELGWRDVDTFQESEVLVVDSEQRLLRRPALHWRARCGLHIAEYVEHVMAQCVKSGHTLGCNFLTLGHVHG